MQDASVSDRVRGTDCLRRGRYPHGSSRMTHSAGAWRAHAAALADRLTEQRIITDPAWHAAVAAVPRHVFVSKFFSDDDPPELLTADDPRWLGLAYSDDTLVTQRREHPDQPRF